MNLKEIQKVLAKALKGRIPLGTEMDEAKRLATAIIGDVLMGGTKPEDHWEWKVSASEEDDQKVNIHMYPKTLHGALILIGIYVPPVLTENMEYYELENGVKISVKDGQVYIGMLQPVKHLNLTINLGDTNDD
ncbi:hypothetical protein LCGC14_0146520 [marine sediment metagenome]|uniref:Uncharacterized protein n=1 Tax=marine sediment metagenome TaxID=412755 RepID=A0A0F9XHJ9_9ZZZZ